MNYNLLFWYLLNFFLPQDFLTFNNSSTWLTLRGDDWYTVIRVEAVFGSSISDSVSLADMLPKLNRGALQMDLTKYVNLLQWFAIRCCSWIMFWITITLFFPDYCHFPCQLSISNFNSGFLFFYCHISTWNLAELSNILDRHSVSLRNILNYIWDYHWENFDMEQFFTYCHDLCFGLISSIVPLFIFVLFPRTKRGWLQKEEDFSFPYSKGG